MADTTASVPFDPFQLLGGLLALVCISFALYGVGAAQAYVFMLNSKKDTIWLKSLVVLVFVMETLHSAFVLRLLYYYTLNVLNNFPLVSVIDWSVPAMLFTEDVLAFLVQGFYVWRIWFLSGRSLILTGILSSILLLRIGSVIATAVFSIKLHVWDGFEPNSPSSIIAVVSVALSAGLDGLIACGMIYYLWRSQSGLMKTAGVTRWLMAYCVNTNLVNVLVAIVIAVTYAKLSHNSMMFLGWIALVSKLYSNAFLGTLNARHLLRQNMNRGIDKTDVELPHFISASSYGPGTVQASHAEAHPSTTFVISNSVADKSLASRSDIAIST